MFLGQVGNGGYTSTVRDLGPVTPESDQCPSGARFARSVRLGRQINESATTRQVELRDRQVVPPRLTFLRSGASLDQCGESGCTTRRPCVIVNISPDFGKQLGAVLELAGS